MPNLELAEEGLKVIGRYGRVLKTMADWDDVVKEAWQFGIKGKPVSEAGVEWLDFGKGLKVAQDQGFNVPGFKEFGRAPRLSVQGDMTLAEGDDLRNINGASIFAKAVDPLIRFSGGNVSKRWELTAGIDAPSSIFRNQDLLGEWIAMKFKGHMMQPIRPELPVADPDALAQLDSTQRAARAFVSNQFDRETGTAYLAINRITRNVDGSVELGNASGSLFGPKEELRFGKNAPPMIRSLRISADNVLQSFKMHQQR